MKNQDSILIFGSSGQIGKSLIRKFTKNNYRVIAVTRSIHQKGYQIKTQSNMINILNKFFSKKSGSKRTQQKFKLIGQNILQKTLNEINLFLKNEI